jgi:hypothetical protein
MRYAVLHAAMSTGRRCLLRHLGAALMLAIVALVEPHAAHAQSVVPRGGVVPRTRAVVFDFETTTPGTRLPPTLWVTTGGLTAGFSTDYYGEIRGPVAPGGPSGLSGNVLGVQPALPDPIRLPYTELSIGFSAPAAGVSLDFLLHLVGQTPAPITLNAFFGGSFVGSTTVFGAVLPERFPGDPDPGQAGVLWFSGAPFDAVTVGTEFPSNLYVDDVAVNAPEPSAAVLLASGLLAAAGVALRRRRAAVGAPRMR